MNTEIRIPGKEVQVINDMTMTVADVIAAYSGRVDLSVYTATTTVVGDTTIIEFKNKTGTKGNDRMDALFNAILNAIQEDVQEADEADDDYEFDIEFEEEEEVTNTEIRIPGKDVQVIEDMVLTAEQVIANFSGRIDLRAFSVNTYDSGANRVIEFTQRTGTKG